MTIRLACLVTALLVPAVAHSAARLALPAGALRSGCLADVAPPAVRVVSITPGPGGAVVEVEASDDCRLALVLLAIDGDVVAARTEPPWSFRDVTAPAGSTACAIALDGAGNSTPSCAPAGGPSPCDDEGDCAPEDWCERPIGACDEPGTCVPRPEVCTADYVPVCGCDGVTWSNACVAAQSGTAIAHEGECE